MTVTLNFLSRRWLISLLFSSFSGFSFFFHLGHYPLRPHFFLRSCVSSCLLDRPVMLPDLESNDFMKQVSCGAQKLKTLFSPVPGALCS